MAASPPLPPGHALPAPATQHMSLTTRALLAAGLMIGFYLLALGLAAGLLYIPYAEWQDANRLHANIAIFCGVGALGILWAIMPRADKFAAPGPRLEARDQPELFQAIEGIAVLTGQKPPAEVYLVSDVNAWVADRGGILGFGARRVMGLGLPLLQTLSVAELRAVLAHEFGHFFAGDTRLGPWIYRTRSAIARTLENLHGSLLQKPFIAYAKVFLRISHAVSRKQEYAADALAARTIGAQALIEGLKKVHGAGLAFDSYWRSEVVPVLHNGFRPPIAEGFRRFLNADSIVRTLDAHVAHALTEGKAQPYDTHPSLRERISALNDFPSHDAAHENSPAVTLMKNVDALELELLRSMSAEANRLKALQWQDVGAAIYLPLWEKTAAEHANALKGITLASLPETVQQPDGLAGRMPQQSGEQLSADERKGKAQFIAGAAIATLLRQRGWRMTVEPGASVRLEHEGLVVHPFAVVHELSEGVTTPEAWRTLVIGSGIGDLDLGDCAAPATR